MREVLPSLLSLVMVAALPALGKEPESPVAFAERVVQAINTKSFAARRALAHPASLPCLDGDARDLFEEVFQRDFTPPVPAGYKVQVRELTGVSDERLPRARIEAAGAYPVRPSHFVLVSFPQSNVIKSVGIPMLHDGQDWREVWACPTPDSLQKLRAQRSRFDSDCSTAPADAVLQLPAPMNEWLEVRCLPVGHALRGTTRTRWLHWSSWEEMGALLAQCRGPESANRHAHYFTRFEGSEVTRASANAEEASHNIFSEGSAKVWKLTAGTSTGDSLTLYFFKRDGDETGLIAGAAYGGACAERPMRFLVRLK